MICDVRLGAPLLDVSLSVSYKTTVVLDKVKFSLCEHEAFGVVGSSGAGKSTLLLAILGLLRSDKARVKGRVMLENQDLLAMSQSQLRRLRGKLVALIPQSPMSALSPVLRLGTHFREAWLAHEPADDARMKARIEEVLVSVSLPCNQEFLRRRPSEVSVGQAQRFLIALALIHRPKLLIADEPTSALDPVSRMNVLKLLQGLTQSHCCALLYISHDILSVVQLCHRVAILDKGRIVENLRTNELAASHSSATLHLLQSLPVPLEVLLRHEALRTDTLQELR